MALAYAPAAAKRIEPQLSYSIIKQQNLAVLNYIVLPQLDPAPRAVDARWEKAYRVYALEQAMQNLANPASAMGSLRDMLAQLGVRLGDIRENQLSQEIAKAKMELANAKPGQGSFSYAQNFTPRAAPYNFTVDKKNYLLSVKPINAQVNLNLLDEEALERYLRFRGLPEKNAKNLAKALAQSELREQDDQLTEAKKGWQEWEDILSIPHSGPDLLYFLQNYFALAPSNVKLDPAYVKPETLAAVTGLEIDLVKQAASFAAERGLFPPGASLFGLLGQKNAAIWRRYVQEKTPERPWLLVELSGGGLAFTAVYDPAIHSWRSIYEK